MTRRERIAAITDIADPAELGAIEAIMLIDQCLDCLTAIEFEREAKIARFVYAAMDEESRAWYRGEGRMVS